MEDGALKRGWRNLRAWQPEWHPGQLVIFWIAMIALWLLIVFVGMPIVESGLDANRVRDLSPVAEQLGLSAGSTSKVAAYSVLGWSMLLTLGIIPVLMLIVTWKWFGGRKQRRPGSPTS